MELEWDRSPRLLAWILLRQDFAQFCRQASQLCLGRSRAFQAWAGIQLLTGSPGGDRPPTDPMPAGGESRHCSWPLCWLCSRVLGGRSSPTWVLFTVLLSAPPRGLEDTTQSRHPMDRFHLVPLLCPWSWGSMGSSVFARASWLPAGSGARAWLWVF